MAEKVKLLVGRTRAGSNRGPKQRYVEQKIMYMSEENVVLDFFF